MNTLVCLDHQNQYQLTEKGMSFLNVSDILSSCRAEWEWDLPGDIRHLSAEWIPPETDGGWVSGGSWRAQPRRHNYARLGRKKSLFT